MIRVGVGGWNFPPWRGTFYPKGLPQAQELKHASSRLTSIEINGTFYRTQTPATFRKWAAEVPDGFVFAVKGPSYISNRSDLTAGEASVARFFESGVTELGDKLGVILWQLSPSPVYRVLVRDPVHDRGDYCYPSVIPTGPAAGSPRPGPPFPPGSRAFLPCPEPA